MNNPRETQLVDWSAQFTIVHSQIIVTVTDRHAADEITVLPLHAKQAGALVSLLTNALDELRRQREQ